jgi:hypothetical protein
MSLLKTSAGDNIFPFTIHKFQNAFKTYDFHLSPDKNVTFNNEQNSKEEKLGRKSKTPM